MTKKELIIDYKNLKNDFRQKKTSLVQKLNNGKINMSEFMEENIKIIEQEDSALKKFLKDLENSK